MLVISGRKEMEIVKSITDKVKLYVIGGLLAVSVSMAFALQAIFFMLDI
jgi:hypothetical protein